MRRRRPGSLDGGGPGWRSATTVLALATVLVLGAAAAAYAALTQPAPRKLPPKVVIVAQAAPHHARDDPAPRPPHRAALGTPTTIKPLPSTSTPPKIPLTAPTPKTTRIEPGHGTGTTTRARANRKRARPNRAPNPAAARPPPNSPRRSCSTRTPPAPTTPTAIPTSWFGDPSLAIDGETSTALDRAGQPGGRPEDGRGARDRPEDGAEARHRRS